MTDHELESYRARAAHWLRATLEPRRPGATPLNSDEYTDDYLAEQRRLQRTLFDGGYAGIDWPADCGGQGLTRDHVRVFGEEAAAYRTPDLGVIESTTYAVCGPTVLVHASDELQRRHIPRMLAGEELWAQLFSEPGAGSDLAGVSTSARRDGAGWRISGSKIWTSAAHLCDYGLALVRTDPEATKYRGLTWFVIPLRGDGVTVRRIRKIDGTRGFCEEFFDEVYVPDAERVGEVNQGWTVTQTMLVFERDSEHARNRASLAAGPLAPDLVELARTTGRLGRHDVRQAIATAHCQDYVRRQLPARAGEVLDRPPGDAGVAAYGKLAAGVFSAARGRIGMQIAGSAAAAWDAGGGPGADAALDYLNSKVLAIAGGTNEMQRNAIAERILGLPREPRPAP